MLVNILPNVNNQLKWLEFHGFKNVLVDLSISHAYFDCFDHFLLTKNKVARNDDEAMSVIGTTKLGIVTNNALAVPLLSSEKGEKV